MITCMRLPVFYVCHFSRTFFSSPFLFIPPKKMLLFRTSTHIHMDLARHCLWSENFNRGISCLRISKIPSAGTYDDCRSLTSKHTRSDSMDSSSNKQQALYIVFGACYLRHQKVYIPIHRRFCAVRNCAWRIESDVGHEYGRFVAWKSLPTKKRYLLFHGLVLALVLEQPKPLYERDMGNF